MPTFVKDLLLGQQRVIPHPKRRHIYVITEADRSYTTALLLEDY